MMQRWIRVRGALLAGALLLCALTEVAMAQAPVTAGAGDGVGPGARFNPALEREAAERGTVLYRSSCGFCHGAEGRGAQGPDLTQSLLVHADSEGNALGQFLKTGKPDAGMPPFPNLRPAELAELSAFLRSKGLEPRAVFDPASIVVGDATAGERFFNGAGQCNTCHSATGDLRGIGSRYSPLVIQGRTINPRAVGPGPGVAAKPLPAAKVTVTLDGNATVSGDLVQVNDFFVTLVDSAGVRRTIPRDNERPEVEIVDPLEAHRQRMLRWTDSDMWNITAYLVSLK
jgi:cytochrome c oxidase cbb3-type subunit III